MSECEIPLFSAPLQGIPPIATLEMFVVYCSSFKLELIISGRAPGRGPEGTGKGAMAESMRYEKFIISARASSHI